MYYRNWINTYYMMYYLSFYRVVNNIKCITNINLIPIRVGDDAEIGRKPQGKKCWI